MKVLPTMGSMYSGSLRGITAGHNKGGLYFRGRTIPTNPNTARQQSVRSVVNGIMQSWSDSLSETQRQAWRDYAENVPIQDSLGQTMTLSGVNWYVKSQTVPRQAANSGLATTGATITQDAPVMFNTGESIQAVTAFQGDFTAPPGEVNIEADFTGEAPTAGTVFVFIAPPQTPGTRFYKGPYQLATFGDFALSADNVIITADLSDPTMWDSDTTPVPGWDELFVPLKLIIQYDDGRRSEEFRMLVQFSDVTP